MTALNYTFQAQMSGLDTSADASIVAAHTCVTGKHYWFCKAHTVSAHAAYKTKQHQVLRCLQILVGCLLLGIHELLKTCDCQLI